MAFMSNNYASLCAWLRAHAPHPVTVIGAAKAQPISVIEEAVRAGISHIGDNYLQEAKSHIAACGHLPVVWHFIGRIQRNKAAALARLVDWVHSVDSLEVAQRLSAARGNDRPPLNICLQVNVSGENSKAGVSMAQAPMLIAQLAGLPCLRLRGLMTIPAYDSCPHRQLAACQRLADLRAQITASGVPLDVLSMGMSADYQQAVRAGATHIRLGTTLFGER